MSAPEYARPHREGRREDSLDSKVFQPDDTANHVHKSVERPQLMQMQVVRRCSMYPSLGVGHATEDGSRLLFDTIRERGRLDSSNEVVKPVGLPGLLIQLDTHVRADHATTLRLLGAQFDAYDAHRAHRVRDDIKGSASIYYGSENHVSAGSANTLEVG